MAKFFHVAAWTRMLLLAAAFGLAPASSGQPLGIPLLRTIENTSLSTREVSYVPLEEGRPAAPSPAYQESDLHVWALAVDEDGAIWTGLNQLATYEAGVWRRIGLPSGHAFRGVACADNRVYVGATGAIGYLELDSANQWSFVSLLPALEAAGVSLPPEVLSAHATREGIVFVTRHHVLRWRNKRFEVWPRSDGPVSPGWLIGGRVHCYDPDMGLRRLDAEGLSTLYPSEQLPAQPVAWMVESPAGSLWMGAGDAIYAQRDGGWIHRPEASAAVAGTNQVCATALDDDTLAVGTYGNGLILLSVSSGECSIVSRKINYVSALLRATPEQLWIGTSRGLAVIESPLTVSLIDQHSGLTDGLTLRVVNYPDRSYAITSQAVYAAGPSRRTSHHGRTAALGTTSLLRPLEGGPVLIDAESERGGQVWIGGKGGIWQLDRTKDALIQIHSGDVTHLLAPRHHPGLLFYADHDSLHVLTASPSGSWQHGAPPFALPGSLVSWVEDDAGELWISTVKGDILRLTVTPKDNHPSPVLVAALHHRHNDGLPEFEGHAFLTTVGSRVFAFTPSGILQSTASGFEYSPEFSDFVGQAAAPSAIDRDQAYWVVQSKTLGGIAPSVLLRITSDPAAGVVAQPLQSPQLGAVGYVVSLSATASLNDNDASEDLWIGGYDSVLRIDSKRLHRSEPTPPLRLVRAIFDHYSVKSGTILRKFSQVSSPRPVIDARASTVRFAFTTASGANAAEFFFQTRVGGLTTSWSPPQKEASSDLHGLPAGEYRFEARALDAFGQPGPPVGYDFHLRAPWYWRPAAIVGWVLLLALFVVALIQWRGRRLRQQNLKLGELVQARTHELELSNLAKEEFLESISHEIRNPLNGIVGLTSMLREEVLPPTELALVSSLKTSAAQLQRVTEEVLGAAKLEYADLPREKTRFNLLTLINEVVEFHHACLVGQKNTLRIDTPSDFTDGFEGDAGKLRIILSNLLVNALKYAPGTLVTILVECAPGPAPDNAGPPRAGLTLTVRDHGPGIPVAEQALIFQKFVRGSHAKQQRIAGAGLGLATCRVLAQKIGARLALDSQPGQGAAFILHLTLPRADCEPDIPADVAAKLSKTTLPRPAVEKPPPSAQARPKALVVEDEEYNRVVLGNMLSSLGYYVHTAANAASASALIEHYVFEVAFLDWELPDAKGGTVAQMLRDHPAGHVTIIIATTAHDSADIQQRCLSSGMNDFLLKPYNRDQIQQAIASAHDARRAPRIVTPDEPGLHPDPLPAGLNFETLRYYGDPSATDQDITATILRFVETLEERLQVLSAAVQENDFDTIARMAHQIGSLSGMAGAVRLNRAARALGLNPCPADTPGGDSRLRQIAFEIEALRTLYLSDLSGASGPRP